MLPKRIVVGVVGLAAAGAVGAGVAYASIPGSNGVINGCYKSSGGDLKVIDSSASCASGYKPLNWNQAGPQGPAGANGVSGLETRVASGAADAESIKSIAVSCSSGKRALGGGFEFSNPGADVNIVASTPTGASGSGTDNATGWVAEFNNHETTTKNVSVWVVCATVGS